MYILGINGGFRAGYQDVSACLIKDGEVIVAIEEERISRVKFSAGKLPYLAILEVLKIAHVSIEEVNLVAFHGSTWEMDFDKKIETYFLNHFGYSPAIKRFHHHNCHAAATFYSAGYDEALILTMDNSGDGVSMQIAVGNQNKIEILKRFDRPQSLGLFYSLITQYCGFTKDNEEYKLMGLAAFGDKYKYDFSWLLSFDQGEYVLDTRYIHTPPPKAPSPHRDEMNFNSLFVEKMGFPKRTPHTAITQFYKDVAASAQYQLEQTILHIAAYYVAKTGIKNICTAGGVALNCLMSQKLMNAEFVHHLFVQPAATDAGISMGAAWLASVENGALPKVPTTAFLGNEFSNEAIENTLHVCQVAFKKVETKTTLAANDLAEGRVIAWFQGRMEFGPRALGNRSILASPCFADMQQTVNQKVKFRESFRPFGASVLVEDMPIFFEGKEKNAPFMTLVFDVKDEQKSKIPAVVHADGSCRIQTVSQEDNPLFFQLITDFKKQSEVGLLLNTSFNLNHEPIVNTPREAIASFFASGIDVLYLGDYRIQKNTL